MAQSSRPRISVIITTKNSSNTLNSLLESIKDQTFRDFETVVIDNNSSDSTKDTARKYTRLVFNKGPERSIQRNFGARHSTGEYLLFLDSDMILSKSVLAECVSKFRTKDVGGVIIPEKSFGLNFWANAKTFEREINEGESYFEAARFFPRSIFEEYNGYSEDITGPEDWDLPRRIAKKYSISRIKCYIFHNEGSPTPIKLMKRKYYYGLTAHKYLAKNNISALGPQTLYFLRPAFYRNWRKLLSKPLLTIGMFILLFFETLGGGLGYLRGRFNI